MNSLLIPESGTREAYHFNAEYKKVKEFVSAEGVIVNFRPFKSLKKGKKPTYVLNIGERIANIYFSSIDGYNTGFGKVMGSYDLVLVDIIDQGMVIEVTHISRGWPYYNFFLFQHNNNKTKL